MKVTPQSIIGDGCTCEGKSLMNACWISQSVFHQVKIQSVIKMQSVYLKENNECHGEITFHLKKILKRFCYYKTW